MSQVTTSQSSGGFSPEQTALSLDRMRECARRAHLDTGLLSGELQRQAQVRCTLFAQSAADLAGTSIEEEIALAAGERGEPGWSLT